jgi:hypothetical protein
MKSHAGTSDSHSWWDAGGGREILSITDTPLLEIDSVLRSMKYTRVSI